MYVYFIEARIDVRRERKIMIKIGYGKNPKSRLRHLQVGSPVRLALFGVVWCSSEDRAKRVESECHKIFAKQQRHGEWFRLGKDQIAALRSFIDKVGVDSTNLDPGLSLSKQADAWLARCCFDRNGNKIYNH